ncbi:MAG TPA: VWA domain-containing protein [Pyrinomonadaceae bacterium]|jgi:Ca-activated chloride channel family protein|nr:VWA domain-containing protein [Pyrinomonadaceae bacterium]
MKRVFGVLLLICGLVVAGSFFGSDVSAVSPQNRPRNTQPVTPSPSPTPKPASQRPAGAPTLGEPPPVPKLKPTPTPTPPEVLDPDSIVRVNTDLVQLHVRVIDRNNKPINDVPETAFHVFEDGVPQPIENFSREEVPISYGLAVDTSGSLRSQLQSVIDAGKTIINSNKQGDETFLVRFISSDKIETVQDFTSNKEALMDGLDSFYVEGGQTAVIDAVYLSAEHVSEYKNGDDRRRRALIVITDGEDRNSFYKQEQLFARLREEDVQIFVIGFINELDKDAGLIRKSPRDKAVTLINKLATETGGRAFFPDSIADLPQIANEIIRDLRTQYVIAYNPTNKTQDGSYRAIKVTVDQPTSGDKRIALTRTGRLTRREGAGGSTPKPPSVRLPASNVGPKKP